MLCGFILTKTAAGLQLYFDKKTPLIDEAEGCRITDPGSITAWLMNERDLVPPRTIDLRWAMGNHE